MVHIVGFFGLFFCLFVCYDSRNHSIKELILKTIACFSLTIDLMMLESSVTKSFIF